MQLTKIFSQNQYPIIYENGEETAVVVDIKSFRQIEFILDNLLNREQEPEDEVVAEASALWQRMIREAKTKGSAADWIAELHDL